MIRGAGGLVGRALGIGEVGGLDRNSRVGGLDRNSRVGDLFIGRVGDTRGLPANGQALEGLSCTVFGVELLDGTDGGLNMCISPAILPFGFNTWIDGLLSAKSRRISGLSHVEMEHCSSELLLYVECVSVISGIGKVNVLGAVGLL
jgi:hypothetical protein